MQEGDALRERRRRDRSRRQRQRLVLPRLARRTRAVRAASVAPRGDRSLLPRWRERRGVQPRAVGVGGRESDRRRRGRRPRSTAPRPLIPTGTRSTYSWQVLSTTGPAVTLTNPTNAQPSFPATDDGVNQFRVTVDDGLAGAAADTTVTVTNVAASRRPDDWARWHAREHERDRHVRRPRRVRHAHRAFDWGDGTPSDVVSAPGTGSGAASVEHHYASAGTYAVVATVVDDDGGQGTATASATIATATHRRWDTAAGATRCRARRSGQTVPVTVCSTCTASRSP